MKKKKIIQNNNLSMYLERIKSGIAEIAPIVVALSALPEVLNK